MLVFTGTMGAAYVQTHNPAMMRELLITVDVFGISEAASDEQRRIAAISRLSVPYEQRDALRNRKIFLGANQEMVVLALDQPKNIIKDKQNEALESWVYYFQDENRPTTLFFKNGVLVSAEKSSTLDVAP